MIENANAVSSNDDEEKCINRNYSWYPCLGRYFNFDDFFETAKEIPNIDCLAKKVIEHYKAKIFNSDKFRLQSKIAILVSDSLIQFFSIDYTKEIFSLAQIFLLLSRKKA